MNAFTLKFNDEKMERKFVYYLKYEVQAIA